MPIFNSLGSSYSWRFRWLAVLQLVWPNRLQLNRLKQLLARAFTGEVKLVWKGRDAIELVLDSYGLGKGDKVLTQAFCCYSVEEAVKRTGAEVVYADLPAGEICLDFASFKQAVAQCSSIKAVILQHVLGYIDEVAKIARYCRQHDIILIEDLAQSVGAEYQPEHQVGELADACVLSFGRDKLVDGVSGGAAIIKTKPARHISEPFALDSAQPAATTKKQRVIVKDMIYPLLTGWIRNTYSVGLGKALHSLAKKLNWLYSPVSTFHHHYQSLPAYYAPLVIMAWNDLEANIEHRRKIAHYYFNRLNSVESVNLPVSRQQISRGANLRFPILVDQPQDLLEFLKRRGIHLEDRWYRQAVATGRLDLNSSCQPGSCPHAEELAAAIVNLPTHRLIGINQADKVASAITAWAQT